MLNDRSEIEIYRGIIKKLLLQRGYTFPEVNNMLEVYAGIIKESFNGKRYAINTANKIETEYWSKYRSC